MKLNDLKHNHSLTDLLKVFIFSVLMLVPFLSVATRCLYVICNKNANESYSGHNTNDIQYTPTEVDDLQANNEYQLTLNTLQYNQNLNFNFDVDNVKNLTNNTAYLTANYITIYTYSNNYFLQIYADSSLVMGLNITTGSLSISFTFIDVRTKTGDYAYLDNMFIKKTYLNEYNLDNAFEYSIDKIAESQYYNWTQNTAIYTGIETMTTQLGITGATIPILLTYWFMLTIIYVVIDIILKIFTVLTHMLGSKTAK